MIVLLDTNSLLLPHQHRIDVFAEIERLVLEEHTVATLSTVVDELRGLVGSSRDGVAANVGLQLIREKGVGVIPAEGDVDDSILDYAERNDVLVCTNDHELKSRLRAAGIEVLCMRGKGHLDRL
jgi:rRNA-processing protein FCF1